MRCSGILEREGVIAPEARAYTDFYFGERLRLAGGAKRVLREALASIRARWPTALNDGINAQSVAQSSAGQVFSMMRAPLRSVILAPGQRLTAASNVAWASKRSFTPS